MPVKGPEITVKLHLKVERKPCIERVLWNTYP